MTNFGTGTVMYLCEYLLPDFFLSPFECSRSVSSALVLFFLIQIRNVNTDLDPDAMIQEKVPFFTLIPICKLLNKYFHNIASFA